MKNSIKKTKGKMNFPQAEHKRIFNSIATGAFQPFAELK